MDILFGDVKIERLCSDEKWAKRQLGARSAKKLAARLADLRAALSWTEVLYGRPHQLKGDLAGCMALDLDGGMRLVLEAADDPIPVDSLGNLDWRTVTIVRVVLIGDYHD